MRVTPSLRSYIEGAEVDDTGALIAQRPTARMLDQSQQSVDSLTERFRSVRASMGQLPQWDAIITRTLRSFVESGEVDETGALTAPPTKAEVPDPLQERIDRLIERVRFMRAHVGQLPQWDAILARRLDGVERALEAANHDVVYRDIVVKLVRERGTLLARDRRKPRRKRDGVETLTAQSLADELVHEWLQAPWGANPYAVKAPDTVWSWLSFGTPVQWVLAPVAIDPLPADQNIDKALGARKELALAIEAASHKGRGAAEAALRTLLAKLGLDLPTAPALRQQRLRARRKRTKRDVTK